MYVVVAESVLMFVLATKLVLIIIILTYFAMILPGKAKLRVCFLPFVGLKIADGLEVSTASVDSLFASPEFSLRFCEPSVSCTRLALTYVPTLTWFSGAILYKAMFRAIVCPMAAILVKASVACE